MTTLPPGITEAQTLTADVEVGCDVAIVGSGPGGAVVAATLARAGLSVVVLEEGGAFTKARFRGREDEAYPLLYQDGGQRVTKDLGITLLQGKAMGGGSVVNWTTCFRTPDHVIDHWRTRHAVGGFDGAALAPHFAAMEQRLSIAPVPLELLNRNNRALYDGCKKLGWAVEPTQRNVLGCAYSGHCGHGCPIDAKQSMLVTLLPDAMQAGAAVVTRCRVQRVVFEAGRVTAVIGLAIDASGTQSTGVTVTVKPRFVVIAGGAINSPALLLRSAAPDPHGVLGRRTFLHPVTGVVGVFDDRIEGWRGAPQSAASHQFAQRGDEVGFFLEVAPIHPMLMATAMPGIGTTHRDTMARVAHFAAFLALTIDGFHDDVPGGRVTLSKSGAPVLAYPIAERQWRAFRDGAKALAKVAFAAGAKEALTGHDPPTSMRSDADLAAVDAAHWEVARVALFSAHQMGGCGMSDDAKSGVVRSEDLRHHQIDNLHVVDGSVFPTSLGVNPQLSIYGLAHLMAERLVARWKTA
ncbi:MAG: FAD-binding protein [Deltaproteobacteria bacterium]|nr:FAD-binding protein [Deltaproteobacteria bacterium]